MSLELAFSPSHERTDCDRRALAAGTRSARCSARCAAARWRGRSPAAPFRVWTARRRRCVARRACDGRAGRRVPAPSNASPSASSSSSKWSVLAGRAASCSVVRCVWKPCVLTVGTCRSHAWKLKFVNEICLYVFRVTSGCVFPFYRSLLRLLVVITTWFLHLGCSC